MLSNPVLAREVRVGLRTRKALACQAMFLAALCGIVFFLWPQEGVYSIGASASRLIFVVFFGGQLVMAALISPAMTASSITSEKESGSFDLLFASPLEPHQIISGKLAGAVILLVLIIVSSLPLCSICLLLGGVDPGEMAGAYGIVLSSTVLFGLVGLCWSAYCSSSHRATVAAYLSLLAVMAGVWVPSWVLANWSAARLPLHVLRSFSPVTAMLSVVQPELLKHYGGDLLVKLMPQKVFLIFCWALCFVLVAVFTALIKRKPAIRSGKREQLIEDGREIMRRRMRFPYYLIDPLKRKRMIGDFSNPVRIKEVRSTAFGKVQHLIRGTYVCFAVSAVLVGLACSSFGAFDQDVIRVIAIAFPLGLVVAVGPSLTSGSLTSEKEQGNYDMLRMTSLSRTSVVLGKLEVALSHILILMFACLPVFFVLYYLDYFDYTHALTASLIVAAAMFFAISTGLFCSSLFATTAAATVASYAVVAVPCVGTFFAVLAGDYMSGAAQRVFLVWNPFVAAINVSTNEVFSEFDFWRMNVSLLMIVSVLLLIGATLLFSRFGRRDD